MWKRIAIITAIGVVHGFLTVILIIQEWGSSGFLGFFPTPGHVYWNALANAFQFPILTLFNELDDRGRFYDVGLVLNSGLWALLLYHLGRLARGRRRARTAAQSR